MKIVKILTGLILAIIVIGGVYFVYQDLESTELTTEVRESLGGTFAKTSHGYVHYELSGPENADLVVLVHGYTVPGYLWEPTFQFLLKEGYRVLRFDLFGRGFSDRPDEEYDLNLYSDQISNLLQVLKINRPIQLLGLSMGGPIVTRFTNQYPEKVNALILQDPMVNQLSSDRIFPLEIPLVGEYLFGALVVPTYVKDHINEPSKGQYFAHWGDQYQQQLQYKGFRRAILSSVRHMATQPFIEEYKTLSKMEIPKLVIWGSEDEVFPVSDADILTNLMPDIKLEIIQGAGHVPSMDLPEEFNAVLLTFLQEHPWKPTESK